MRFRLIHAALGPQHVSKVIQRRRKVWMILADTFFPDAQGAAIQRLRVGVAALNPNH
eukprot:CAMPEP_0197396024 /NCGR_PEP_ID=MMETSP1165-20131217/8620_1 /TAXON_ID=284809 /ORGANISM="Chrysocystis fragilis, Strain CCMP3189" /LENGTH=56 /DNA_ID=CAMNT_0042921835 /DNA_START=42 /DNA_END=209 /DNA_ORIENTATION=-